MVFAAYLTCVLKRAGAAFACSLVPLETKFDLVVVVTFLAPRLVLDGPRLLPRTRLRWALSRFNLRFSASSSATRLLS